MARDRRRQAKRDRSPGAALAESAPPTPQVGPRYDNSAAAAELSAYASFDGGAGVAPSAERSVGSASPLRQSSEAEPDAAAAAAASPLSCADADVQTEGCGVTSPAPAPLPLILPSTQVTINVGGRVFTSRAATLCAEPSLLSLDVLSHFAYMPRDGAGLPFYDRDPDNFSHILNFLRGYPLMLGPEEARHLAQDAVYFDIKGLRRATGVDAASVGWTFQKGPGVSADGRHFRSAEVVSLIGAGPLVRGETSVVFFRIEKLAQSQLAVGLVPPTVPLDAPFTRLEGTLCYDSAGEVSCSIIGGGAADEEDGGGQEDDACGMPVGVAAFIPRMLVHDLTKILGAAPASLTAYGLDEAHAALTGRRGASQTSPSLLAVSNARPSHTAEWDGDDADGGALESGLGAFAPYNATGAPTLTAEVTAPRPQRRRATAFRAGAPVVLGSAALPAASPALFGVASPFVLPQQQPLQPLRAAGSLQPSMLPPMPSPMVRGHDPAVASPALGPASVPETPNVPPMGTPSLLTAPQPFSVAALQQQQSPTEQPCNTAVATPAVAGAGGRRAVSVARLIARLPILCATACPLTASVPRAREGDELCVVSHLSEDGTVAVVRFYKGGQLLHVAVGLGPWRGESNGRRDCHLYGSSDSSTNSDDGDGSDDEESESEGEELLTALPSPAGLNASTPRMKAAQPQEARRRRPAGCQHRLPLPPLQLALYARSVATVVTSDRPAAPKKGADASRVADQQQGRQSLPQQQGTEQRQAIPNSVSPIEAPGTPGVAGGGQRTNGLRLREHEGQLQLLLRLLPDLAGEMAAAATEPMTGQQQEPVPMAGGTVNHAAVLELLTLRVTEAAALLLQSCPPLATNGFLEYFLALPRFFSVPDVSAGDFLSHALAAQQTANGSADAADATLYPISNNFQSVVAVAVHALASADSTIEAMARRQHAAALSSLEQLEAKRRASLAAATAPPPTRRRGAPQLPPNALPPARVAEWAAFFLPEPASLWDDRSAPPPRAVVVARDPQPPRPNGGAPPNVSGGGVPFAFRSAREMLDD